MSVVPETAGEAERFLAAHPDIEAVDLLLTDANGVARGKRLRPHELPPARPNASSPPTPISKPSTCC